MFANCFACAFWVNRGSKLIVPLLHFTGKKYRHVTYAHVHTNYMSLHYTHIIYHMHMYIYIIYYINYIHTVHYTCLYNVFYEYV